MYNIKNICSCIIHINHSNYGKLKVAMVPKCCYEKLEIGNQWIKSQTLFFFVKRPVTDW